MQAGLNATRNKMVHDGTAVYQRIKNKRPTDKMLLFGEKVVWIMPKASHRTKKLPRIEKLLVLTLEGAVAARTVHCLSEDHKWDTEFMSRVEGAPWDFKAKAGDRVNDGGIPERADARRQIPRLGFRSAST